MANEASTGRGAPEASASDSISPSKTSLNTPTLRGLRTRRPKSGDSQASSPKLQRKKRRVSAGSATDPIPVEDDGQPTIPEGLETPSRPPRNKRNASEPSKTTTTQTPPSSSRKSKSSPEVYRRPPQSPAVKELGAQNLYNKVAELIWRPPKYNDIFEKGNNYVFRVVRSETLNNRHIKVGTTKNSTPKRQSSIKTSCKHEFEEEFNPNQRPHRYYKITERLIKAELHELLHNFDCSCPNKTVHTEYFTMSASIAVEVTQRWTAFCEKKPWDEFGKLHPFWEQRLLNREVWSEEEDNFTRRAEHWHKFVNASRWDIVKFNLTCLYETIWPRRWQFVCSIQAIYMMYVTFPDAWVIVAAWAIQFALFLDSSFGNNRLIMELSHQRARIQKKRASSKDKSHSTMGEDVSILWEGNINETVTDVFAGNEMMEVDIIDEQEVPSDAEMDSNDEG